MCVCVGVGVGACTHVCVRYDVARDRGGDCCVGGVGVGGVHGCVNAFVYVWCGEV